MLKYLLETNLQQQVVSQELAQSLRAATQELLAHPALLPPSLSQTLTERPQEF